MTPEASGPPAPDAPEPLWVVIPYLVHGWALEDCIESMGKTSVPVLVVDNSEAKDAHTLNLPDNVEVYAPKGNIGISSSWNLGLDRGADQTLICSQWVRFAPAEYPRRDRMEWGLDHIARGLARHATPYGCTLAEQGFHLISVGRALVDRIGLFDETLLAYGEDDDYRRRMDLAGLGGSMGSIIDPGVFSIGYGIAKRTPGAIDTSGQRLDSGAYWRLKWGTSGSDQPGGYPTPFGNPDHPLSYWPAVRR